VAIGILACRTARPVDVWLGQPFADGRSVSERQRQDLGREQVAGLGVEAEQGQGLGGTEGRSRVTVDELFLRGSNQRTKMKRLRRIHHIKMELGTGCHVKLDLDPPRSSASCFTAGDDANGNPDRFIIRSVIPFHPIYHATT
jgi:hypothetical protein